jgi:uncharacterized protein (DUF983 family)
MLSKEQESEYVKGLGSKCPFCGSEDLMGGDRYFGKGYITYDVRCQACEEEWAEDYTLTGIVEAE